MNVRRLKQPYTSTHAVHGIGHQVFGYTYENKVVNDLATAEEPEWGYVWEQHDLGLFGTLSEAQQAAKDWRASLVGQYEVN